jgi:hypothetical protein
LKVYKFEIVEVLKLNDKQSYMHDPVNFNRNWQRLALQLQFNIVCCHSVRAWGSPRPHHVIEWDRTPKK